jgi:hypothetical protein
LHQFLAIEAGQGSRQQACGDRLTIEVVVERQLDPGEAIANDGLARCANQWD